ncbi:hypothetical protein DI396_15220 [Litorivita pollutaquae]|uniref:Uncharacterized protein n=1 Tax=Litorivita pollutaquae TaxID=2200892 RepID=A0A2V4MVM8_9RHOB|nr:DUF6389 family protein [Litorivita pollutaquae]PYC46484.1 hypothetical protein DI396_15220 [Litorivita pollutaquae]
MNALRRLLRKLVSAPAPLGADIVSDEALYRSGLREAIWPQMGAAVMKVQHLLAGLPDDTEGVDIGIHPDPEQSGSFTVMAHVFGPDLYALNKAVEPYRELLCVRMTGAGPVPPVPLPAPFGVDFATNDIICDVAADWVTEVWFHADGPLSGAGNVIFGEEGYGASLPRKLA